MVNEQDNGYLFYFSWVNISWLSHLCWVEFAQEDCLFLETGPKCPKLRAQFRMTYFPEKKPEARDVEHLDGYRKKYKLDAMIVLKRGSFL